MYRFKSALFTLPFLLVAFICNAQSTDEYNLDEVYSIGNNGTISLQSDDANVTVTGSDRSDVRVIVHYKLSVKGISFGKKEKFEMIVEENNGNLKIHEKERDFGNNVVFGSSREEYDITIEAPRGVSLDLEGDDENYQITAIDGSFRVDADDSNIELQNCNGDDFSFDLDDGEIQMDRGKGKLSMDIDDGDVRILSGDFDEIDIETDDSEIDITTRLFDTGNYRFDLDDGDLRLNIAGGGGEFEVNHDDADISTSRQFEQTIDDEGRSVYRLSGGNAKVRVNTDDGDINFRVI